MFNRRALTIVSFLLFLGSPDYLYPQKTTLDSLNQKLIFAKHDSTKIRLKYEIGEMEQVFRITYWDSLKISCEKNLDTLGRDKLFFVRYYPNVLNNLGFILDNQGNIEESLKYYNKSLYYRKKYGDKKGIAGSLNNIANVYDNLGDIVNALDFYYRSLKIREEINDINGIAECLNNIGYIYRHQGEYKLALNYYQKSLLIKEKVNDKKAIARTLNNIGILYGNQGDSTNELFTYLKSLKIREEINDQLGIANSFVTLGSFFYTQKKYLIALNYYNKGLRLYKELEHKQGISHSLVGISRSYLKINNRAKSIYNASLALKAAKDYPLNKRDAAEILHYLYKSQGDYKKAYDMYSLYILMRDSIANYENNKIVFKKNLQYDYEKKVLADSISYVKEKQIKEAEIAKQKAEIKTKRNQQYALFGGLFLILLFSFFLFNRFQITKKQKNIIEQQKHLVDEKQKEILDSITYAQRLQQAILTTPEDIQKYLPNSFLLYQPKDIVAGDFYFFEIVDNIIFYAAADCTGHGVPGAMVSVVCANALTRSIKEFELKNPGKILDKTRELVLQTFNKSGKDVKDGMDISLCKLEISDSKNLDLKLEWAGANNPLWIIRKYDTNYTLIEIKPNKQPVGKVDSPVDFTNHTIELQKDDTICIFTDGYQDQFGGEKNKKFKTSNMKNLLLSIQKENLLKQKEILMQSFEKWKGSLEQVDDICIIGIRI
ncbi:MAG: Photosystem I assembly protein Ycf3 [Flavobacteriales bacterium]|nr:Photosystem I assembly protein Ycf3 [Flavobacteriales bacterium]